jgi:hypothetical protein
MSATLSTQKSMPSKPKQWVLSTTSEKFQTWHYEAGEGSNSGLWIDLRWSIKRNLYVSCRSNALDGGEKWTMFARPIKHHAVAKRQAFEAIAWASVPLATVHEAEEPG